MSKSQLEESLELVESTIAYLVGIRDSVGLNCRQQKSLTGLRWVRSFALGELDWQHHFALENSCSMP